MAEEDQLLKSIERACDSVEGVRALAAQIALSIPEAEEGDDVKRVAALLVADATLSGKTAELRNALRSTRLQVSVWIRILNVLLLAVFLVVTPEVLHQLFPWLWAVLVVIGAVLALAWSVYKTHDEGGVLAFIRYLIAQRASVVRLLGLLIATALVVVLLWWSLPPPDATVLVLLPYSGTLLDDLAKGDYLDIKYGDKDVATLRHPSGAALYLGWPPMRTRWFITCTDCDVHTQQPDLTAIASKVLADGHSKVSAAPDVARDWTIDRRFISTPCLTAGTKVTVTIRGNNIRRPLQLHPWPSGKPSTSYAVLNSKGAEVLILSDK